MGLFGRKNKEPDPDDEYLKNMALADQQQGMVEDEIRNSIGSRLYMFYDPYTYQQLLQQDPDALPAYSFVNHTANLSEIDRKLINLEFDYFDILTEINMSEDQYETKGARRQAALRIKRYFMLSDAMGGWKGRLVAELSKKIVAEFKKPQKKGRFF